MTKIKWLPLLLALLMLFTMLCAGCGKNSDQTPADETPADTVPDETEPEPEPDPEPEPEPEPEDIAAISERAMNNFLAKITASGYVMDAKGYLKTSAYSDDVVLFDFEDNDMYNDFAVMSLNDEVFQGVLDGDAVTNVRFLTEGTAFEAATPKLPSYFLNDDISEGNIYNLFYNDTEDPMKFVSYDDTLKNLVRGFVGYSQMALNYMHEVYLILDQEDPTVAHIQVEVDDDEVARYYFDDIDLTIEFGGAQSDARVDAWLGAPEYPAARTGWTETDIFVFNSVFLPEYGEKAVPYVESASYALMVDEENFVTDDVVSIRDPHGTQEDVDAYIEVLKKNGFEEAVEDGVTCYRLLLREDTKCYSSIDVAYDNGLNVVASKYYDFPTYEGLDAVNGVVTPIGFPALDETEAVTDLNATDRRFESMEGWLYFYDYKTVLYVIGSYADYDQLKEYLDAYAVKLVNNGFEPVYVGEEEDGEVEYFRSADQSSTFRYHFEDDGETVTLLFKAEKVLTADEAKAILGEAGFPEFDMAAFTFGRNLKKFEKVMFGRDYESSIMAAMDFETTEEAEAFLDAFVASLEDDGFLRVPPSDLGSNKNNGYTNEDTGLGVGFDFYPAQDGNKAQIYFDFKSGIDFEAESEYGEDEGPNPILGSKTVEQITAILSGEAPLTMDGF